MMGCTPYKSAGHSLISAWNFWNTNRNFQNNQIHIRRGFNEYQHQASEQILVPQTPEIFAEYALYCDQSYGGSGHEKKHDHSLISTIVYI